MKSNMEENNCYLLRKFISINILIFRKFVTGVSFEYAVEVQMQREEFVNLNLFIRKHTDEAATIMGDFNCREINMPI